MKSKTLSIIQSQYTLLEQDDMSQLGADVDPTVAPDPTQAASPEVEAEPEVQKLTSQGEVNLIQKLVTLMQTAVTSDPDESTKSMIVNFDVDSINTSNAKDMLKKFESLFVSNKSDYETAEIDNKYGL